MPVTAKLSKHFYDRLGDQIANELVEWFNQVDATYRADLRDINELNFGRFDAKVEQRFAEQDARLERRFAEFETMFEKRILDLETKFEKRILDLETQFEKRFADFEMRFAALEARFERRFAEQMRFLYLALAAQIALIAGLYLR